MQFTANLIKAFFIAAFFLYSITAVHAGPDIDSSITIVKKLDQDWMIYNKKFNDYIFYLPDVHKNTHTVNQWVEIEKYRNYKLGFSAAPGLVLFVNNRLIYKNIESKEQKVKFNVSDFLKYQHDGKVLFTFYNTNYQLPLNNTYIFSDITTQSFVHQKLSSFKVLKREKIIGISIYVMTFLFVLFAIVIVKHRYVKRFNEFFTFQNVLPNIWMEETAILKIYSSPIVLILGINAILMAIITGVTGGLFFLLYKFTFIFNVGTNLLKQLVFCALIYFVGLLAKYLLLSFISWIFDLSAIVKIQYFEFVKGLLKLNIAIASLAVIFACIFNSTDLLILRFVDQIFIFLLTFIVIRTAFIIFKLSTFRNIYLFSYLCTTEIVPLAIIIKIILFWNN